MLKKDRERSFWDEIDYHFMTEESEGEDHTVVRHMLPWRSECEPALLSCTCSQYPSHKNGHADARISCQAYVSGPPCAHLLHAVCYPVCAPRHGVDFVSLCDVCVPAELNCRE